MNESSSTKIINIINLGGVLEYLTDWLSSHL